MSFPRLGTWDSFYGKWNGSYFLTDPNLRKLYKAPIRVGRGGGGAHSEQENYVLSPIGNMGQLLR